MYNRSKLQWQCAEIFMVSSTTYLNSSKKVEAFKQVDI